MDCLQALMARGSGTSCRFSTSLQCRCACIVMYQVFPAEHTQHGHSTEHGRSLTSYAIYNLNLQCFEA